MSVKRINIKHGHTIDNVETTEYKIWCSMKGRCYNKNSEFYNDYGGRGIKVCDRWLHSFPNFFKDMGNRPSINLSLDRKNNDKGYSKSNCRWATKKEQSMNRRNNLIVEFNGVRKPLKQWCEDLELNYKNTHKRIKYRGWTTEKAFLQPPTPQERLITLNGKTQSVTAWAKELNMASNTIRYRLDNFSIEESLSPEKRPPSNQFLKKVA